MVGTFNDIGVIRKTLSEQSLYISRLYLKIYEYLIAEGLGIVQKEREMVSEDL